jgi:hypothetical protein
VIGFVSAVLTIGISDIVDGHVDGEGGLDNESDCMM